MERCLQCGAVLAEGEVNCEACGRLLAGTRRVAEVPLAGEAVLIYDLLASAGFQPVLAWLGDGGRPRVVARDTATSPAAGLLPPVTNPFAVFVPEDEADEAIQVLQDARRAGVSGAPSSS